MRLRLLLPVLLLAASATAAAAHAPTQSRTRLGDWTLLVRRDPFSGATSCRLTKRGMSYERGVLILHLPENVDTSDAVYRIDGGNPIAVENDRLLLASLGFAIWHDDLANPSGGLVRIPVKKLGSVQEIEVEASSKRIWRFTLGKLPLAINNLKQAGCE